MEEIITSNTRVNVDEVLEKIHSELGNIDINSRHMYIVKVGTQYAVKNTPEAIKAGKARYVLTDKENRFFKETEAQEAARALKGKVITD